MTIWMDVDAALSEVPVNACPLIDSGDFVTIESAVAFNAAGLALTWHFVTTAGAYTATSVTPTSGGTYDWNHQAQGVYSIEIPASGGASINNDTEGFGYFTGVATGVLPWRGPTIGFRDAGLNNALIDSAYSATRGLAGTALPAAAADAAGGLPISDAGGLDLDARLDAAVSSRMASYTQPTGFLAATFPNGTIANTTNITAGTVTTTTNLTNAPTNGDFTATMKTSIGTAVAASAVASVTGNVGGSVGSVVADVSVGNMTAGALADFFLTDSGEAYADAVAGSVVKEIADNAGGSSLTVQDIVDGVWDEPIASHLDSGSTGAALNGAGAAGDPWTTPLPGAYGSGTAGFIVGTNIDAAITSRMASYTQPTGFLAATFPGGTIANTTNITAGTVTTATNVTTVNGLANNVITAASTAADYVTEVQNGLATSAALATTDGKVDSIQTDTNDIQTRLPAALDSGRMASSVQAMDTGVVNAAALASDAVNEIADGLLDRANAVETGLTPRQQMRLAASANAGKTSGGGTGTFTIRNAVADSKNRVVAVVDASGNRSAITYDVT